MTAMLPMAAMHAPPAPDGPAPARPSVAAATIAMDTMVSVEVVAPADAAAAGAAVQRALGWFTAVEQACSRFDPQSEVRRLLVHVGTPVPASPILFEAARFALVLAGRTGGAFDPTVGHLLEARGFDRNYLTGEHISTLLPDGPRPTYRAVALDLERRTITLRRPLVLDLGAVAKGLAIDLAARELAPFGSYCVDAGGDLFAAGHNAEGRRWQIGVQHPRHRQTLACTLEVSGRGVCTSGDYERRAPSPPAAHSAGNPALSAAGEGSTPVVTAEPVTSPRPSSPSPASGRWGKGARAQHHLLDPRTGEAASDLASVTVIAPTAMAADGLATAAFVLGPRRGLRLLRREGVEGILITPSGDMLATQGVSPGSAPHAAHHARSAHL